MDKIQEFIEKLETQAAVFKSRREDLGLTDAQWIIVNARWQTIVDCINDAKLLLSDHPTGAGTEGEDVTIL